MATDYEERLNIPLEGDNDTHFATNTGFHVATGYTCIVIGKRGPYIEFNPEQIILKNLHVPEDKRFKLTPDWREKVDYFEWRTNDEANVKVYEQLRTVDYADYKVGLLYVSPFDLVVDGEPVITKLNEKKNEDGKYLF